MGCFFFGNANDLLSKAFVFLRLSHWLCLELKFGGLGYFAYLDGFNENLVIYLDARLVYCYFNSKLIKEYRELQSTQTKSKVKPYHQDPKPSINPFPNGNIKQQNRINKMLSYSSL